MSQILPKHKHIIIFSTNYFPFVGGAEVAIKEITDRISAEFEMIVPRYDRTLAPCERIGNVQIHRVGFGSGIDKYLIPITGLSKVIQLTTQNRASAFWAMMVTFSSGVAYLFNIIFFWKKIPIILTLQEGDSKEHISGKSFGLIGYFWRLCMLPVLIPLKLREPRIRIFGRQATGMIELSWRMALIRTRILTVISSYLKAQAEELGFSGHVAVIPNGVDVRTFSAPQPFPDIEQLKRSLRLENKRIIITTSRLVLKNAVDDVIRALAFLPTDVHFMVLGIGPDLPSLKELALNEGVAQRVHFLGQIDHAELPKYLHAADVFVRPSLSEGMGNSFVEAMAAGVPIVATPVGGIPDFLFHGSTGLFCRVRDPKDLALQVERLLTDFGLYTDIVTKSEALVREKYDWSYIAQKMQRVLLSL